MDQGSFEQLWLGAHRLVNGRPAILGWSFIAVWWRARAQVVAPQTERYVLSLAVNGNSPGYSDLDRYTDPYADTYSYCHSDQHADSHTNAHVNLHCHADGHANIYADVHTNIYADKHADSHRNCYTNAYGYTYGDAN